MGNLVTMTAQRKDYDDPNDTAAPSEGGGGRRQRRNATTTGTGSWFKTLLLAGGSAVAAVIAVDFYRSKIKGDGGSKDEAQAAMPGAPQIALPPQTFVPMPMPFPMPMPGYGMPGYGGAPPAPPERRMSAKEEEEAIREEMKRMLSRRKLGKELERERLNAIMEEMLEE